ncbi:MAG: basic amino acid/polyamine antiporter, family [Pyrinomonadaceae bacterium]|jgi:APA family basic amino acid/polyamine antiporter|nr:basic amino acid/polyamine antiporter, family [Pyrinomonadaceae bacterium]
MGDTTPPAATAATHKLARRLNLFDATMLVMGGIIGAGIFVNPAEVARQVHTPLLILGAWIIGGLIALAGAFVYAELAARRPEVGGQYAYLRDAYHPTVAFLYGWSLLLVIQSGGMAAVAITFARYFAELTGAPLPEGALAALALALLTAINCLGVRAGSNVQSALMVLKIAAIAALVLCGWWFTSNASGITNAPALGEPLSFDLLLALGAALTPVMFAYGGWQTTSFVAGEMREPRRDLARGLLFGVIGVVLLYTAVSFVCVYALGAEGLAATTTPASSVMRGALGERGARLIALGITVSTLGFLSQSLLTTPRVYFAMAEDGLFFRSIARVNERTRVPVFAIALQGAAAIVIALSGRYGQILSYVVSVDFIWFGLTGLSLFIFRRHARGSGDDAAAGFKVPGHPYTTALFVAACWLVVVSTVYKYPANSAVGFLIVLAGVPASYYWLRQQRNKR